MEDLSLYSHMNGQVQLPEQEHQRCPRCDSADTKFCYYNNYNLSQPRHYCRTCRRYWTRGGALRNIPVGGGSRKNSKRADKRPPSADPGADVGEGRVAHAEGGGLEGQQFGDFSDACGSYAALQGAAGGYFDAYGDWVSGENVDPRAMVGGGGSEEGFVNMPGEDGGFSGGGGGWPDLSMYPPGSTYM